MGDDTGPLVTLNGSVDFRRRTVALTTASARHPAPYPPFESRYIDGWQYLQIDPAVSRPATVRPNVRWIAFQGRPGLLPVPDRTLNPMFPLEILDDVASGSIASARVVDAGHDQPTRIQFRRPRADTSSTTDYTATIGADGRIDEISSTTRFRQGGATHSQTTQLTLTWTADPPRGAAPPSDQVQRLAPGENLYPSTGSGRAP
jgi:hypothetical protein